MFVVAFVRFPALGFHDFGKNKEGILDVHASVFIFE